MEAGSSFQEALNAKSVGGDYKAIIKAMKPEERKMATQLINKTSYEYDEVISVDAPHLVDFGFGIPMMIVPDLLTKTKIIENKFTTGWYSAKTVAQEKQGTIYYWGVKQKFGLDLEVVYQIFNKKKGTIELVPLKKTQADVDEMLHWIKTTLDMVKHCYDSDNWGPKSHGRWGCLLGKTCPCK